DINNICFEAVYRAEQRGYGRIDEGLVLEIAAEEGSTSARTDSYSAEAMLKTREGELSGDGQSAAPLIKNDVPESEASHQEPADEISDGVETDAVRLSAFEKTLEALLSSQSDSTRGCRSSRPRQAVMPV